MDVYYNAERVGSAEAFDLYFGSKKGDDYHLTTSLIVENAAGIFHSSIFFCRK